MVAMPTAETTAAAELKGLDPRKTFYLLVAVANLDGSFDLDCDRPGGFAALNEAVASASQQANDDSAEFYIYEARPVKRISRAAVRVEDIA